MMSNEIWIVIGIIFILVWSWIIWEFWNSPIYPDDYNEEGINPDHERINGSNDKKQKVGFYNGKENTWIEDNRDPNEIDNEPHMDKRI